MNHTDKIGQQVLNRKGEKGTVTKVDDVHIFVEFPDRTPVFQIDAFEKGFLTFVDPVMQKQVNDEVEAARAKAEEERRIRAEFMRKKAAEEASRPKPVVHVTPAKKTARLEDMFGSDYHVEHLRRQPILPYRQVEEQFGISLTPFGRGINPKDDSVVLISNISKKGKTFVYHDHWTTDGDYIYSGEGRLGDQKMAKGNLAIVTAKEMGRRFIFS